MAINKINHGPAHNLNCCVKNTTTVLFVVLKTQKSSIKTFKINAKLEQWF
jgi:hypothetical protein